jgi:hypothetical protein
MLLTVKMSVEHWWNVTDSEYDYVALVKCY